MQLSSRLQSVLFFIILSAIISLQVYKVLNVITENKNGSHIQVILDAQVTQNDIFQLYYLPAGAEEFSDENSVRLPVYGQKSDQLITFDLPVDSISGLRIDLGQEPAQKEIDIQNVLVKRGDEEVIVPFASLGEFFDINQFVKTTPNGLNMVVVDGVYDPFIVLKPGSPILSDLYIPFIPNPLLITAGVFLLLLLILLILWSKRKPQYNKWAFLNLGIYFACYAVIYVLLNHYNVNQFSNSDKVTVTVKAKVANPDFFQLFYTTPEEVDFKEGNSIRLFVDAKDDMQDVKFTLPESINVRQLRLDISEDITQAKVQLKSISVEHNGSVFEMLTANSLKHMYANEYMDTKIDSLVSFTPKFVNNIYDPFLYSGDITNYYQPLKAAQELYPIAEVMSLIISLSLLLFLQITYPVSVVSKQELLPVAMSITFLLLLAGPYLKNNFWQGSIYENFENRILTPAPSVVDNKLSEYPEAFTAYYNDNFGFRNELIEVGRDIRLGIFRESFIPEKVAIGENGWLFLSGEYDNVIDDYARRNLYDSTELKLVANQTLKKKEFVESKGAKFYKVFYPNSHSIYTELLPYQIRIQKVDTLSRVDQVNQYLQETGSKFQVIDVREELIAAKKDAQVYLKHDTHWNDYGAFIGYKKLFSVMSKDFPDLHPKDLSDYKVKWELEGDGDLLHILGVRDFDSYQELKPKFTLANKMQQANISETVGPYEKSVIQENMNNPDGLVAVIFHDSYTIALKQFISPHFKKVVYYWGNFNQQVIENEKPDIVIEGNVERYFH